MAGVEFAVPLKLADKLGHLLLFIKNPSSWLFLDLRIYVLWLQFLDKDIDIAHGLFLDLISRYFDELLLR